MKGETRCRKVPSEAAAATPGTAKPGHTWVLPLALSPQRPPELAAAVHHDQKAPEKCRDPSSFQSHAAISIASAGETATLSLNFSQAFDNSPSLLEKNEFESFYPSQEHAKQ